MFFVDQVGVKAPGSPRRITRRPLQRCAKFTSFGPGKLTSKPTSGALSPILANARLRPSTDVRRKHVRASMVRARDKLRGAFLAQRRREGWGVLYGSLLRRLRRATAFKAVAAAERDIGWRVLGERKAVPSICETVQRSFAAVAAGCSIHAGQRVPHALDAL